MKNMPQQISIVKKNIKVIEHSLFIDIDKYPNLLDQLMRQTKSSYFMADTAKIRTVLNKLESTSFHTFIPDDTPTHPYSFIFSFTYENNLTVWNKFGSEFPNFHYKQFYDHHLVFVIAPIETNFNETFKKYQSFKQDSIENWIDTASCGMYSALTQWWKSEPKSIDKQLQHLLEKLNIENSVSAISLLNAENKSHLKLQ